MNKKTVFAAVYIIVTLIAYYFFFSWNVEQWRAEQDAMAAEFLAEHPDMKGFEPHNPFFPSAWGRNVVWVGGILGLSSPLVILAVFRVLDRTERKGCG